MDDLNVNVDVNLGDEYIVTDSGHEKIELNSLPEIENEMNEVMEEVRENIKNSSQYRATKKLQQRYKKIDQDRMDSGYWLCCVFQNREQREEFARKSNGLISTDELYIDGFELAKRLGITLETPIEDFAPYKKAGKNLESISFTVDEFNNLDI